MKRFIFRKSRRSDYIEYYMERDGYSRWLRITDVNFEQNEAIRREVAETLRRLRNKLTA
jgi:hypothetical protein